MMKHIVWRICCAFGLGVIGLGVIGLGMIGLSLPNAGHAQNTQGIVALVNNEIISAYDLEQRVRLFYVNANISPPSDPQALAQLRAGILDELVDELLKEQETKRVGIRVSRAQVVESLAELAQRNNMDLVQLENFVASRDIDLRTLYQQAERRLAWDTFVQRGLGVRVVIGDEEIAERLQQLEAVRDEPRYLLREILLPYGYEFGRERVQELGNTLVEQLRRGADFRSLAQRFSFAPSAAIGGDVGWTTLEQLHAELRADVTSMRPGDISEPILTEKDGAYILQLLSKERYGQPNPLRHQFELLRLQLSAEAAPTPATNATAAPPVTPKPPHKGQREGQRKGPRKGLWRKLFPPYQRPALPTPAAAPQTREIRFDTPLSASEQAQLDARLEAFVQRYTNCKDTPALAQSLGITEFNLIGPLTLGALGRRYQDAIINLQEGDLSAPIAQPRSYELFAVCRRVNDRGTQIDDELVRRQLYNERLQLRIAQRIRELRRRATIEIRLAPAV